MASAMDSGFLGQVGHKKLGNPEGYSFFRFERIGPDANKLTAGREGVHEKGRRKGQACWLKPYLEVIVTDAEKEAAERAYESETGRCHGCRGDGEEIAGWSQENGLRMRLCHRCHGSGKAPESEAVSA